MHALKNPVFWAGFVAGYILLVVFPQLNVRAAGIKASVGRA
jgi:hypothetical protein